VTAAPRYEPHAGADLTCLDCGAIVADKTAHTRFHSILSGHAWSLAVLKTAHLGANVHDRYDVPKRIDSKKFDSWTNDALADVIAGRDTGAGTR
jgi:hypothetical protein